MFSRATFLFLEREAKKSLGGGGESSANFATTFKSCPPGGRAGGGISLSFGIEILIASSKSRHFYEFFSVLVLYTENISKSSDS